MMMERIASIPRTATACETVDTSPLSANMGELTILRILAVSAWSRVITD